MLVLKDEQIITPENRHRKLFDQGRIMEMAKSIADVGLIHLPVVRKTAVEGEYNIVAGERRLRAMRMLLKDKVAFRYHHTKVPEGGIPVALFEDLDPTKAREIELEENAIRVDLTWQERAAAISELHEVKKLQDPNWTMVDTAEAVTGSRSNPTPVVRDRILLAQNMGRARVASAPNEKEALKILKRELQQEFEAFLGASVDTSKKSEHTLKLGDSIALMREIPDGTFDVILTDPPYGVDAQNFDAEMVSQHEYDDSWKTVENLVWLFFKEAIRVTADQAHVYVFCDILRFPDLKIMAQAAGFDCWPRPIIWHKDTGHIPRPNHGPKRVYECILYALKGDKLVTALYEDVITCPAEKDKIHAAQKPVDLYCNLLRRSAIPGSLVLDPFCGSGTIFEAAAAVKCRATGFDSDPAAVGVATKRLARVEEEAARQPSIFEGLV